MGVKQKFPKWADEEITELSIGKKMKKTRRSYIGFFI